METSRLITVVFLTFLVMSVEACKKAPAQAENPYEKATVEQRVQEGEIPTVLFDIRVSNGRPSQGDSQLYDCTYVARGKTAKFRIHFRQDGPLKGDFPMARAEGKFVAVAGSDNSVLLEDLKKALDAKHIPKKSLRAKELLFDAVVLGEKQSRDPSGSYSSNPAGDWIAIKIFVPKNGDEGEFFLNLNPVLGKGEFSLKDPDYGDYLLREFARVL